MVAATNESLRRDSAIASRVSSLRWAWRRARRVPGVGALLRFVDRVWWTVAILRSDLVDEEYYGAQFGKAHPGRSWAVRHYVFRNGYLRGHSLNPFFDEERAGASLPDRDRVPALYAYLLSHAENVQVHPLWRPEDQDVESRGHVLSDLTAGRCSRLQCRVGDTRWAVDAAEFRRLTVAAANNWRTSAGGVAVPSAPATGLGSCVIAIAQSGRAEGLGFPELAETIASRADSLLQLVLSAPQLGQWVIAQQLAEYFSGTSVIRLAGQDSLIQEIVGVAKRLPNTANVVVLDGRSQFTRAWVEALESNVRADNIVAPVSLNRDATIRSAGLVSPVAGKWYRLLAGHSVEDLQQFTSQVLPVAALDSANFAIQAGQVQSVEQPGQLQGVAELTLHLSERVQPQIIPALEVWPATEASPGITQLQGLPRTAPGLPDPTASEVLARLGFRVSEWRDIGRCEILPELTREQNGGSSRWAIKTCAPAGPAGAAWGDTHFANGLAAALRRAGSVVAVDAFEASDRPSSRYDDVTVVVRGPYRIHPPRTGVRMLWVISHPDQITLEELLDFDLIFAASEQWAAYASERWGVPVRPLLECTDADLFRPVGLPRGDDIVFVGTARGIARPCVVAPIRAGIPVRVYGPDWRGYIPGQYVVADHIDNTELSARYETAAVVLNDHWPAMRKAGFMTMRVFDAVAAGGRVISEHLPGLEELFEGAVVCYRDEENLVRLLSGNTDELFPSQERLLQISERVRANHSFDARVAEILRASREFGSARANT